MLQQINIKRLNFIDLIRQINTGNSVEKPNLTKTNRI